MVPPYHIMLLVFDQLPLYFVTSLMGDPFAKKNEKTITALLDTNKQLFLLTQSKTFEFAKYYSVV